MAHLNVEIKARTEQADLIRKILEAKNARFVGIDHQIDTYFKVPKGRMKLRQGNIENTLIHYQRSDQAGPKQSEVSLYFPQKTEPLKSVLTNALDILVVVDKLRAIYFVDNVKFHLDEVKELGSFVEIEAIDEDGRFDLSQLQKQCDYYLDLLKIRTEDLIEVSYSDLLLKA